MSPEDLDAFHAGDPELFRWLVDHHSPRLLAHAYAYVQDDDAAHDVVQDVWVAAFRRRRQLESAGAVLGWLLAICRNRCVSETRRADVRARDLSGVRGVAPTTGPDPLRATEMTEARRALAEAIDQLPPRQRDTVVLRLVEGRSTRETARLLGCAEGTVKAALHHALDSLEPLMRSWRDDPLHRP